MDSRIPSLSEYFSREPNLFLATSTDVPHKFLYADRARILINKCIENYLDRGNKVYIPRYTCHHGTPTSHPNLIFYNVDHKFEPILESSEFKMSRGDLIIFVNYFGYECSKKTPFYSAAKAFQADILFDNSHSFDRHFVTCRALGDKEASVCSYIKSLPIPYGAELVVGKSFFTQEPSLFGEAEIKIYSLRVQSVLFFLREQLLPSIVDRKKYFRRDASRFFNESFDETIDSSGSRLVRWITKHVNYEKLSSHRWKSTKKIYGVFGENICLSLPIDVPPTDIPVYFANKKERDQVASFFLNQGLDVYAWPELHIDIANDTDFEGKDKMLLLPTVLKYGSQINHFSIDDFPRVMDL